MKAARVIMHNKLAGILTEDETGYTFRYDAAYLSDKHTASISLTLPKTQVTFKSPTMFSFFDGLIPEGWLLSVAEKNWKLNERDRMGLLLACCKDCIGAVSIEPLNQDSNEQ